MNCKNDYSLEHLQSQKFNLLTFVCEAPRKGKNRCCKWKCDCGKEKVIKIYNVVTGKVKSCGCLVLKPKEQNPNWKGFGEISGHSWKRKRNCAKERGYEFTITKEYAWNQFLKQNRKCALSGEPLTFNSSTYSCDGTASLDRIDSTGGYVEGNIQWVHKDVNNMKQWYDQNYFIELCKKIARHNA
jgi:hypothetical protein